MPDEIETPLYPVEVEIGEETFQLLDPCGESSPRVELPNGQVTSLESHGGTLTTEQVAALEAAVPE